MYETKRLNADGNPVEKYDFVVYDIDEVNGFLTAYQSTGNEINALTVEDQDLITLLQDKVQAAIEKRNPPELRFVEAQTLMQDAMDLIVDSDALAASDLRKDSATTSSPCQEKCKCVPNLWRKTSTGPTTTLRQH